MKRFTSKFCFVTILSILAIPSAFATGATVRIVGNAVPTLSSTMLIVLSLLLFAVAFRISKQKNNAANKLFMTLIGVSALVAGGSGIKLISNVQAGDTNVLLIPGTESYRLLNDPDDPFSGFNGFIRNNSGQTITVQSITPDATSSCDFTGEDPCGLLDIPLAAPLTFTDGQACFISCGASDSDMRLKKDIKYLSELQNGIKLYSFKYLWSDQTYVGVMAQDLLQHTKYKHAVMQKKDNFYAVYYHMLGLKMITLDQWQESPANILKL